MIGISYAKRQHDNTPLQLDGDTLDAPSPSFRSKLFCGKVAVIEVT
jgi:hypothetical protein